MATETLKGSIIKVPVFYIIVAIVIPGSLKYEFKSYHAICRLIAAAIAEIVRIAKYNDRSDYVENHKLY